MKRRFFLLALCLLLALAPCAALAEEAAAPLQDVTHILLLGFDFWGDERIGSSFSDTNAILTLDRANGRILIATIMRDSYVTMPDGKQSKLNQVVRKSDFETMVATVEQTLGIDIDAYFAIGMQGFKRLINALGGVEVEISSSEYASLERRGMTGHIPGPGKQTLDGTGLYAYVKDRYMGGGDRARTGKAQEVLSAIAEKVSGWSVSEMTAFAAAALEEIKTDASLPTLVSLGLSALSLRDAEVETLSLPAEGTFQYATVHGSSIVDADWAENAKLYAAFLRGEEENTGF